MDLDGSMIQVAADWFGLEADSIVSKEGGGGGSDNGSIPVTRERGRLCVIEGDGVEYIMSLAEKQQGRMTQK